MSRMHSGRKLKLKVGITKERKQRSSIPISPSFAASSYSQVSSRSVSTTSSTRASTPIDAPQSLGPKTQLVQHTRDPSSNMVEHVTGIPPGKLGQSKTAQLPVETYTDQQLSAVHDSSGPVKEEKERTDEAQPGSETEIEKLKMEVEKLTSEVDAQGSKLREQANQLQNKTSELEQQTSELKKLKSNLREAKKECIETANSNRNLRNGITEQVFEVMDFLGKHAFRKEVYEKWKDQEMPDDDSIVNEELMERQKGIDSILMGDYLLIYGEFDQVKQERAAQQQRITKLEREIREQAQGQVAEVQAQNETLTQENDTLRTRVEGLQNQQNEAQQRNNALEAQRRGQVGVLLSNLITNQLQRNALINRCNEMREQRNDALRQLDIMREDNEDLARALENTVNQYEEERCFLLYQMAEMHGASWSEADLWRIIETLEENPRKLFNKSSQSRSSPPLRWAPKGGKPHLESMTPDGQWQQTGASQYAQQFPDSRVGLIVRIARRFHS